MNVTYKVGYIKAEMQFICGHCGKNNYVQLKARSLKHLMDDYFDGFRCWSCGEVSMSKESVDVQGGLVVSGNRGLG